MINVLVAEDSPTIRAFLTAILEGEPDIKVIGAVADGTAAVEAARHLRPDVVTMDIHMPGLDGFAATREIMETAPVPIVIVSGAVQDEMAATFKAVEAGALAFVRRPAGLGDDRHESEAAALVTTVRLMSEVKVVRRWKRPPAIADRVAAPPASPTALPGPGPALVAVGASTGGPLALQAILAALPADFPLPILVVQHIAQGFVQGYADWLGTGSALPVSVAVHGQPPLPGHVYVAPDDRHLLIDAQGRLRLEAGPPEAGLRPAVAALFRSVAEHVGRRAVGVLLSGMGSDGSDELCRLRALGAITIAQDAASSVVHGMPGVAIDRGGASFVLPPAEIAAKLVSLVR